MLKKLFYGILAAAILVAAYFSLRPEVISVESTSIIRKDFTETLSAEGKVRSRNKRTVYAFASGSIENFKLKLGDMVRKDEAVTQLEWDYIQAVKSPVSGVISKIYRDSAGPIQRGEPIFEVSSLSDLEVVAEVLTPDAIKLSPNGKAHIKNWGGNVNLTAKIYHISRAGITKLSALGVEEERTEIHLKFDKVPQELVERFGDNYHVDVEFIVSQEADVLTVPLGALFKDGENWAVYTLEDGRAKLRSIEISRRNDKEAKVEKGLKEGEPVILFPGDKVREGAQVQALQR